MQTVLLSAPYMIPYLERFRPVFKNYRIKLIVPDVHERMSEDDLLTYAGLYDGAVCGDDRYTARVLQTCAPRLKVISKWGTGIDSIDRQVAEKLGIRVCNTPNAFSLPVADTVLGYMLTFARGLHTLNRNMKAGKWEKVIGRSLSECTLGVIGLGNVGKSVVRRAHGFGMRILGNDIAEIDPAFLSDFGVEMTSLADLAARADFISVNCDLNPTSFHLVNAEFLSNVKPEAILINTARGPIVEEAALIAALESGRLGGAGLDVYEVEPLPKDSPLMKMDQVMLAPHNANSSPTAWEHVHWNTIRNLLNGLGIPCEDLKER